MSKSLSALDDDELLTRLRELRCREREITLEILSHLNEIERRKLHLKRGYSSMFVYCTDHLRYSESAAGRRVQAARCIAKFPQVAELLRSGGVNLSTLGLVAGLLTETNVDEFLARIRGKNQREVEAIASTLRPPVRLRDRVQLVNVPAVSVVAATTCDSGSQAVSVMPLLANQFANSRCGSEESPSVCKTVSSTTQMVSKLYIQFLADEVFMQDYNQACALLSHKVPKPTFAAVFGALLEEFLTRHSPTRRHERRNAVKSKTRGTRAGDAQISTPSATRSAIPSPTRDAVHVRDQGRCAYVGANGRRCGETHRLHIDHIVPKARNGSNDAENLRLLCARHNQLEAELILGEKRMSRYRSPHPSG
jgi:5-methylcytosine-specific restriction endonuclease McrA